jgi:hypothetical protein
VYLVIGMLLLVGAVWYGTQPVVRVVREPGIDQGLTPIPWDSVRLLASWGGAGCVHLRVFARLYVDGRLFSPSNESVHRALRRAAGAIGADAVAFTTPSMDDLPVLGLVDRFWDDGDAAEALRHNEKQVGRAAALKCSI